LTKSEERNVALLTKTLLIRILSGEAECSQSANEGGKRRKIETSVKESHTYSQPTNEKADFP